ncbi:MAG TPA: glutamine-hydrolyzing carbamoyl-phosphate synthase small subunit [Burkholderiales bacterium]|jgi:carbamoyl-phosphate synthase small subunit|nr:glutamine-hydrolyzing carbamoyl-phosphate synthase small subunit [Burkholderiales bacterium]
MTSTSDAAVLVLADGTVFHGRSIGARASAVGEVVFNTAITGYQEILTDPSYCRQLVTLTYPHIGNTGVNAEDGESERVYAEGLIVRDLPRLHSNFRAQGDLASYLRKNGVPGIADIDTRKLTRILREKGAQNGCLWVLDPQRQAGEVDVEQALRKARSFPGLAGMDLAKVVTTQKPYEWAEGRWQLGQGYERRNAGRLHVVACDYGIKHNILRMLVDRGARVTVVPAAFPAREILRLKPDGVFLSNGPGDPEPCDYAIEAIGEILDATRLPVFGICLGHQLMGLASGAKTMKMKFGHHGANHPVKDLDTGRVVITSQNHGFAVDPSTLTKNLRPTHVSLFDGSLQGLARTDRPAFCFQGHPEASPGPHDIGYLFDRFASMMEQQKH